MQEKLKQGKVDAVREFLGSYRELRYEHGRLERKIAELESQCQSATAKYNTLPGGKGGRGNTAWDALVEARERAGEKLAETLRREADVESFINSLPVPIHRQLLRFRYLELLDWQSVADKMGYCERQLRRHHDDALQEARQMWREREEQGGNTYENRTT